MKSNMIFMFNVYFAYMMLIVVFPGILIKCMFPGWRKTKWFFSSFLTGNMIVINLVYVLAFFKIYNQYTLVLGYFLILIGSYLFFRRKYVAEKTAKLQQIKEQYFQGVLKKRRLAKKAATKLKKALQGRKFSILWLLEAAAVTAILLWVVYILSHRVLTLESFSAPDEEVHLQWIQSLLGNRIYHSGIYPFGMHNVVSAVCLIMGKTASQVLKYSGIVVAAFGFLITYLAVRTFTKNRLAVIGGMAAVLVTNLFSQESFSRFQFPVPHEFALPFFVIMAVFLVYYLRDGGNDNLVLFGMGISLTLFSHFHTTIMAGIFCICAGMAYIVHIFKSGKYKKLLLCGIIALVIGAWPVGVGVLQGHGFEQSMAWAVSVIRGYDNLSLMTQRQEAEFEKENKEMDLESEEAKEKEKEKEKEIYPLFSRESLKDLTEHSYTKQRYTLLVLLTLAFGMILYLIRLLLKRFSTEALDRLPFYLFSFLTFVMMVSETIGIPVLLYPTRIVAYLYFTTCFIVSAPLEELYCMFEKWKAAKIAIALATGGILLSGGNYVQQNKLYTEFPIFYYFQTTGVNRSVSKIIDTYPNHTWTLVSVVTETSMTYREGYHYEWIDFLEEVEDGKKIKIPTKYVFFAVEKMPIVHFGWAFEPDDSLLKERPLLDMDDAYEDLEYEENREDYYKYQREIIMAKAEAYVQNLSRQYPEEMTVYYEDDEVVLYRLKQNENGNNLSVQFE